MNEYYDIIKKLYPNIKEVYPNIEYDANLSKMIYLITVNIKAPTIYEIKTIIECINIININQDSKKAFGILISKFFQSNKLYIERTFKVIYKDKFSSDSNSEKQLYKLYGIEDFYNMFSNLLYTDNFMLDKNVVKQSKIKDKFFLTKFNFIWTKIKQLIRQ